MVAQATKNVKHLCEKCGREHADGRFDQLRCWVDCHPRYWWYWTIILALNTLLNLLDLFGFGGH
jgi:hypothetical protein